MAALRWRDRASSGAPSQPGCTCGHNPRESWRCLRWASAWRKGQSAAAGAEPRRVPRGARGKGRCAPRLSRTSAWISSTMTVRTVARMRRPPSLVRRMCRAIRGSSRARGAVGATSRPATWRGCRPCERECEFPAIPVIPRESHPEVASGSSGCRPQAPSGVRHKEPLSRRARLAPTSGARRSAQRNAASVLPSTGGRRNEYVFCPALMAGQPLTRCGGVELSQTLAEPPATPPDEAGEESILQSALCGHREEIIRL